LFSAHLEIAGYWININLVQKNYSMKKNFRALILVSSLGLFTACGSEPAEPASNEKAETTKVEESSSSEQVKKEEAPAPETPKKMKAEHQYILGKWQGSLRDKKLTIVIESIQGADVIGYNIAGSNKRPLQGKIMADDREGDGECMGEMSAYKVVLNEPGDDKWDGTFTLYFGDCPEYDDQMEKILSHSYTVYGSWKAFSGKLSGNVFLTK